MVVSTIKKEQSMLRMVSVESICQHVDLEHCQTVCARNVPE